MNLFDMKMMIMKSTPKFNEIIRQQHSSDFYDLQYLCSYRISSGFSPDFSDFIQSLTFVLVFVKTWVLHNFVINFL